MQHFWHIIHYYFKRGKNGTEMHKKICAVCGEGAVTDGMCQKWFVSFMLEIVCWTMLHGWVDKLELIVIKSK